jgi:hypothetical protein
VQGVSDQLVEMKAVLQCAPLNSASDMAKNDLKRFARFLSGYCARLFKAVAKQSVDKDKKEDDGEGKKPGSSMVVSAVRELTHTFTVGALLGSAFVNEMAKEAIDGSQSALTYTHDTRRDEHRTRNSTALQIIVHAGRLTVSCALC